MYSLANTERKSDKQANDHQHTYSRKTDWQHRKSGVCVCDKKEWNILICRYDLRQVSMDRSEEALTLGLCVDVLDHVWTGQLL